MTDVEVVLAVSSVVTCGALRAWRFWVACHEHSCLKVVFDGILYIEILPFGYTLASPLPIAASDRPS